MVYSCKSCANMFADPLCSCKRCTKASNKKTLETAVWDQSSDVRHIQPYQQPGGSLMADTSFILHEPRNKSFAGNTQR